MNRTGRAGIVAPGRVRELPAAQARKPDVGDQKVQMTRLIDETQSLIPVKTFDHLASHVRKDFDDLGAHVGLVFDDKDGAAD